MRRALPPVRRAPLVPRNQPPLHGPRSSPPSEMKGAGSSFPLRAPVLSLSFGPRPERKRTKLTGDRQRHRLATRLALSSLMDSLERFRPQFLDQPVEACRKTLDVEIQRIVVAVGN